MPTQRQEPRIKRRPNGVFYVHWYDDDQKATRRESLGTKDPAEARRRFAEWLAITEEAVNKDLTVTDALAYYTEHRSWRVEESKQRAEWLNIPLDAVLGHLMVSDLTRAHGRTYARRREAKPGTIRRELGHLTSALNFCKDDGLIDTVPKLDKPSAPPPRGRWLTVDEIDHLVKTAAGERLRDGRMTPAERYIWIGLETGARRASIETLAWSRVDLDRGMIDFRTPGKTVTAKRQSVVPINSRLRPILERAWEERVNDLWVLDTSRSKYAVVRRIFDLAGLKDVSPHTLRHTCATHMARAGTPMWVIAQILGDDVTTVARNYLHHDPDHVREHMDYERK